MGIHVFRVLTIFVIFTVDCLCSVIENGVYIDGRMQFVFSRIVIVVLNGLSVGRTDCVEFVCLQLDVGRGIVVQVRGTLDTRVFVFLLGFQCWENIYINVIIMIMSWYSYRMVGLVFDILVITVVRIFKFH